MITMNSAFSPHMKQAALSALYEYILITLPVAMYVGVEAHYRDHYGHLVASPEWAIATIFLTFQAANLYQAHLHKTLRRVSDTWLGLVWLAATLLIFLASINAYKSMETNSGGAIAFRLFLFILSSLGFLFLVTAAKLVHLRTEAIDHGA